MTTPKTRLRTRSGREHPLPIFLPVYHPHASPVPLADWQPAYGVEGCIVNAYFLYKDRATRALFRAGATLPEYLGFDGLTMTDSGAFQGFSGRLLLSNRKIVAFQDGLGADVISPLDLVTPPGDNRTVATRKLEVTLLRIREARTIATRSLLAGVQQGGRFMDLRRRSVEELMTIGVAYLALGSLVPLFNRNHDLRFVGQVIREARETVGPELPIHVYGAGDPVEIPFFFHLGADVFDSASYGHYAQGGWYMTPYGALREPGPLVTGEYRCPCPVCAAQDDLGGIFADPSRLAAHNLRTILDTVRRIRSLGRSPRLEAYLAEVLERHREWFPDSLLASSWEAGAGISASGVRPLRS